MQDLIFLGTYEEEYELASTRPVGFAATKNADRLNDGGRGLLGHGERADAAAHLSGDVTVRLGCDSVNFNFAPQF